MASRRAIITRGTTPTINCTVTDVNGSAVNLTSYTCFFSIGRTNHPQLTVTNDQMEINGNIAQVTLTQDQTLALRTGDTYMQLRAIDGDVAIATNVEPIVVADVIYDEVIKDVID